MSDDAPLLDEKSIIKYNSRVSRARAANQGRRKEKARMISFGPHDFEVEGVPPRSSPGGAENGFATPSQASPQATAPALRGSGVAASLPVANKAAAAVELHLDATTTLLPASAETDVRWDWNNNAKLLATTDKTNVLRVLNAEGRLVYRVQLPPEGKTVLLGWEPSGAVLAVVQKLGGAFLWFPSKPESVQQWEGMQFASQMMKSSVLQRNTHFDTDFACWSEAGKLLLGLADGNFACWDLGSNLTFMSRKHFAGKLKQGISCGAWGAGGEILAIGSSNQLKVSRPMSSASWENTAAKLYQPRKELQFQKISFSPDAALLAALAGTSVFAHLCVYEVHHDRDEKKGASVQPLGEMHPDALVGAIQSFLWLSNDVLGVVTRSGHVRMLERDEGTLVEEQHVASLSEGVCDALLVSGHLTLLSVMGHVSFFSPGDRAIVTSVALPPPLGDARPTRLQEAEKGTLLVGFTDGSVLRVRVPNAIQTIDLSGLHVRANDADDAAARGNGLTAVVPHFVMRVPPEQAPSDAQRPLRFSYSSSLHYLAVVDSTGVLTVRRAASGDLAEEDVLSVSLPEGSCVGCDWEPGMETVLSVAVRGQGACLWRADTEEGVQMWSGMAYKSPLAKFGSAHKEFDPLVQRWSAAGQIVLGMMDGSFAVWDSLTSQTFASMRSGRHKSGIRSADWLPSLFAPALALGSTSTIKVSQGFDSVEWASTAMKLKLRKDGTATPIRRSSAVRAVQGAKEVALAAGSAVRRISSAGRKSSLGGGGSTPSFTTRSFDLDAEASEGSTCGATEGLDFVELGFSPSGKYLAALATPTATPDERLVIVYELLDQRHSLVPCRKVTASHVDGTPHSFAWQPDDGLLVFLKSMGGGGVVHLSPKRDSDSRWPAPGADSPGLLVDAAATTRGLVSLAFAPHGGAMGGTICLLSPAPLQLLTTLRLQLTPASIELRGKPGGEHFLSIGFEDGGVEVWSVTPTD